MIMVRLLSTRAFMVGFGTTKLTRVWEPALLWNQFRSSYERGCQGKKHLPAPLGDAGVVTFIQPHLIAHLMLRGVICLVALARRTFPRRCQPQLLVPTRRFHEFRAHDAIRFRSYAS